MVAILVKTGECFFRDQDDDLWVAESFADAGGVVVTRQSATDASDEDLWLHPDGWLPSQMPPPFTPIEGGGPP